VFPLLLFFESCPPAPFATLFFSIGWRQTFNGRCNADVNHG
jgi:hypothetical protein